LWVDVAVYKDVRDSSETVDFKRFYGTEVLSALQGSPPFFDGLWQFRRTRSQTELQNEMKGDEKVMKVNYFLGAVVAVFSHPLFSLKYPFFYGAKLTK